MQSRNRYLGDLAKMANGALSIAVGARQEVRELAQQRFERFATNRGWVTHEEFEAVRDMAILARTEQEDLAVRLAKVESALTKLQETLEPTQESKLAQDTKDTPD